MSTSNKPVATDNEIKKGMVTLFLVQIFSTLSYSIIMSSLTIFTSERLHLSTSESLAITGSFLAFNFGLHFLGGYMGGRNISNRMLFCIGMAFQVAGSLILYSATYSSLMLGLAVFLTGSGLNVTCMNNMVTQLFSNPEDNRREKAFLWNYSGMNIGFLIGYIVAGFFGKYNLYGLVFALGGIANVIAIILVAFNWHTVRDRDTYLTDLAGEKSALNIQYIKAMIIIAITLVAMLLLMKHSQLSNLILIIIAICMVVFAFFVARTRSVHQEKGKMTAFCFFLIANVIFWTVYQLSPEILMLFMIHNVDMTLFGIKIMPQWMSNINTIIIILGGPFLAWYFNHLRVKKGKNISLPILFAFAVLCMGIAILLQSIGIWLDASKAGTIGMIWIVLFYVFQSVGELCISPIGYAAIGKLVPRKLQNLMMGLWCMMTGVAAIFAAQVGDWAIDGKSLTNPLITNPRFADTFGILGIFTILVGIIMFILYPKFHKMINSKS